ncbi:MULTISPECIES: sigma factor-like helix-turn-helix DNA-binding protein [unclassified Streptomyces]|uniref:sigma factor-like helix-turn-helix DNA-binding protein n=1 Tax=unclassified Streptomyces TaxID=2593676 RepID=UPI000890A976|nr:sigma-70-like protein [Streptomyces sp. 2321.6]SDR32650.1 Sigma-70, region 4 [Streptomyces sp. KS_16]SED26512.1 Sigma-70, region 4 [Streptomyces sp. 2133.1]SNC70381.1 Sigma-70, region 4 [Streptomyces sp. 2114.4]
MRTRAARRRRSFRDPTARYVGSDVLSQALAELDDAQRDLLLLRLQGAPTAQVARRLDTPPSNVEAVVADALETLRTSGYAGSLLEEMRWEHGPLRSEVVRDHSSEVVVLQRCIWPECEAIVAQPATGRTRLYCSSACRQKAYRRRRSGKEAPSLPAPPKVRRRFTIRDPWADVPELPAPFAALQHPVFRQHIVPRLAAWSRGISPSPLGARVLGSRPGSRGMAWSLVLPALATHGSPIGDSYRMLIDGSHRARAISPSFVGSLHSVAVRGRWRTQAVLGENSWGSFGQQALPLSSMAPFAARHGAARTLTSPMLLGIPAIRGHARQPDRGLRGWIPPPSRPTGTAWALPRGDRLHWPQSKPVGWQRGRTQSRAWGRKHMGGHQKASMRRRSGRKGRRSG